MLDDFKNLSDDISTSSEDLKENLDLRRKLFVINAVESFSRISSGLSVGLFFILIFFSVVFFFLTAGAFFLGELWDNMALGFLAMGGVYLVISLTVMLIAQNKIKDLVSNALIKMI